jgi:hypothetical protein
MEVIPAGKGAAAPAEGRDELEEPKGGVRRDRRPSGWRARARGIARNHWRFGTAVAALVVATWLYSGYRYNTWPQPGFLANVLSLSGHLENDWYTSFPPDHWAIDHILAVVPHSLLPAAVFVLWVVFLVLLWAAFVAICESLGTPLPVAVAAGLVVIPLKVDGFGASQVLFDFFYPSCLSFALALGGLALLLRSRWGLAGAALGLAVLIHPGAGSLAVAVVAPVALYLALSTGRFDRVVAVRFLVPVLVFAVPSVLELMLNQIAGAGLTEREQYEFLAVVRAPHHFLYSAFLPSDYVRTGLWLGVLALAVVVLWRLREARALALLVGTALLLMGAGAVASEHGSPFLLVSAQTSRLSAIIIFLAPAAAAAGLSRYVGWRWASLGLLTIFLVGPWATQRLAERFPVWGSISPAEAIMMLCLIALAAILTQVRWGWPRWIRHSLASPAVTWAIAAAFLGAMISLAVEHDSRVAISSAEDTALRDVAARAKDETEPGQLVLGSPNYDGLRVYAERPDVVEFGSDLVGDGDIEWQRRVVALTGDPGILDPDTYGSDLPARLLAMDAGYHRTITQSRMPICRYHAKMVIAPQLRPQPPWLQEIYANRLLTLYRVSSDACSSPRRAG